MLTLWLYLQWLWLGAIIYQAHTGTHVTNNFSLWIQIDDEFILDVILLLVIVLLQIFAHATTARLSWHVQNFVAIMPSELELIIHVLLSMLVKLICVINCRGCWWHFHPSHWPNALLTHLLPNEHINNSTYHQASVNLKRTEYFFEI